MRTDLGRNESPPQQNDVYILHFESQYWEGAQHYVGYTSKGILERLQVHRSGRGSRLVKYALDHGVDFVVGKLERGYPDKGSARRREIRLKREGHLDRHCEVCIANKERLAEIGMEVALSE